MITNSYNSYKIKVSESSYQCLSRNGEEASHFSAPETTKGLKKLYVVMGRGEVYYVGITSQSISSRLRYGFNANGENGYQGYKWKGKVSQAVLLIWNFPGMNKDHVEAIEAELVYFIREKTGQWPRYQMEIHFHQASDEERSIARLILLDCLE